MGKPAFERAEVREAARREDWEVMAHIALQRVTRLIKKHQRKALSPGLTAATVAVMNLLD